MKQSQTAIFCFLLLLATLLLLPVMQSAGAATTPASAANTCARCMAVVEGSTGRLLYGKNEEQARPMASTTKICTAATVLEHCDNLDRTVAVPDKAVGVEGSSIYLQKAKR